MDKQQLIGAIRVGFTTAGILLLGALSVGCGKEAETDTTAQTNTSTLTVWHDNVREDAMESALEAVGAKESVLKQRKISSDLFEETTIDAIAADADPDVWMIPNDWLSDHSNKFIFIPDNFVVSKDKGGPQTTTEYFKQNYLPYISNDLLAEGGAWGFPGPVKTLVLYKNRDLFSEAYQIWRQNNRDASQEELDRVRNVLTKPTKTWDDLTAAVEIITAKDGSNVTRSGIAMGTANNVEQADDILQLLTMQQGGKIVDATEKIALFQNFINNPDGSQKYPGREALTFYTSFGKSDSPNYSWSNNFSSARQSFAEGKVAMIIDYPEFAEELRQREKRVNFEVVAVPQLYAEEAGVNFAEYYVFGATKAAADPKKAATLAQLLSSQNILNNIIRGIKDSAKPTVNDSASAVNELQAQTAQTVFKRHHNQFDQLYRQMIDDVAVRGQSVEQSINNAADKITELLRRE